MRYLVLLLSLAAPAHAHHEVVVATSMMPLMVGLLVILTAGLAALRQKLRRKSAKRTTDAQPSSSVGGA